MSTSSIIFGLILTYVLYLIVKFYKSLRKLSSLYISQRDLNKKLLKEHDLLISRLNEVVIEKLSLEEQLENSKGIVTNLRRAERKHVATIKKLSANNHG